MNTHTNAINYSNRDHRQRLNALTATHFHEYVPAINKRGGVLTIPFAGINVGNLDEYSNKCHGSISVAFDRDSFNDNVAHLKTDDVFNVVCILVYKDKFLEVSNNYAESITQMLR